jgi:cytochrome c-type biogenesis protein CcmE
VKSILYALAAIVLSTGVTLADTAANASPAPLAPSAVVGAASTYDNQTITVTGTVKNVTTHDTPRGTMSRYQICDSQCVNIVQFSAAPTEGQTQTVTGRFRANVDRGRFKATNVIMVGPPGGWGHGH